MKTRLLFLFLFCFSLNVFSQVVIKVDGIRYLIEGENAVVGRQDKEISGAVIIPDSINYNGKKLVVSSLISPTDFNQYTDNSVDCEGGAFQDCEITSVSIPNTITSLPSGAFYNCKSLKQIQFPDSLVSIGSGCFAHCESLVVLDLPSSLEQFRGRYTFGGCWNLKKINIPSRVRYIPNGSFKYTALDSILIPSNVQEIGEDAFQITTLKKVTCEISNISEVSCSVKCFGNVSKTELFVPKGSLNLYAETEPWAHFKSISEYGDGDEIFAPQYIFANVDSIRYVLDTKNFQAEIHRQFKELSGDVIIPEYFSFDNKSYKVTSIIDPIHVTSYVGETVVIEGGAFQDTKIKSVVLPKSIKSLPSGAFYGCGQLKTVLLPDSILKIGAGCFAHCVSLEQINLPQSLEYFYGMYQFGNCKSLKTIELPHKLSELTEGCFQYSGLKFLKIPKNIVNLGKRSLYMSKLDTLQMEQPNLYCLHFTESTFSNVDNTTLLVPLGAKQVYNEYYPWRSFKEIEEYDNGEGEFIPQKITAKIDGIRYVLEKDVAIVARQDKDLCGDIVIPNKVTFKNKTYDVTSIMSPLDVNAFNGGTATIEGGAFQECQISSIQLPVSIKALPAGVFYDCSTLKKVELPDSLESISTSCFAYCSSLEHIYLPESIRYLFGFFVFGACSSLKKINIPQNLNYIPEGCFEYSGIEVALIPGNINSLSPHCFNVRNLKAIKIMHKDLTGFSYTESSIPNTENTILYVPEGTKQLYSEFYPWKDFKEIIEYKDQNDEFLYNVYRVNCKTNIIDNGTSTVTTKVADGDTAKVFAYTPSGVDFSLPKAPHIEGYEFVRWENIPSVMPANDIELTAVYQIPTGIEAILLNKKEGYFRTLDGKKVRNPKTPGIYIYNGKKIILK